MLENSNHHTFCTFDFFQKCHNIKYMSFIYMYTVYMYSFFIETLTIFTDDNENSSHIILYHTHIYKTLIKLGKNNTIYKNYKGAILE